MDETEGTTTSTETPEAVDEQVIPLPDLSEGTAEESQEATAEDTSSEEEDPITAAVKAALALEADRMATEATARAREENDRRTEEARLRAAAEDEAKRLQSSFSDALREAYSASKEHIKFIDEEGKERSIDDSTFEEVFVKPMQRYNANADKAHQMRIYGMMAQAAMELLPDQAAKDKFSKEAADQPLPVWLKKLTEAVAPHSEFAKVATKEVETKVKAAEARGYVKGQKAPAGTAKIDGGAKNTNQPDLTTAFGIADAKAKGLVDDDVALKAWQKLVS